MRGFLQNYKTDPNDHQAFTKIRMNNTTFMPVHHTKHHIHHGFRVDVFPIISIPRIEKIFKFKKKVLQISNYVQMGDFILANYDEFSEKLGKKLIKIVLLFNKLPNGIKICTHSLLLSIVYRKPKINHRISNVWTTLDEVPINTFCELIEYKFEDDYFNIPKDYDSYLNTMFGNYMQLPPEDQRGGHGSMIVDENSSYISYLDF